MEIYLVYDEINEPCYLVLPHQECGYTAYEVNEFGGILNPVAHERNMEDLVGTLKSRDSDPSVGLSASFRLEKLHQGLNICP